MERLQLHPAAAGVDAVVSGLVLESVPGPLVLSIVSHCLSPPLAPLGPESRVQYWPLLNERHMIITKRQVTSDWRLR